jgi:hypothetical protein
MGVSKMDRLELRKYLSVILKNHYPCSGFEIVERTWSFSKIKSSWYKSDLYQELGQMELDGIIKRISIKLESSSSVFIDTKIFIPSEVKGII